MQTIPQTKQLSHLGVVTLVWLISELMTVVVPAAIPEKDSWKEVKVIDVHTHVFNARDLPLIGALNSRRTFLGLRVPRKVAEIVAKKLIDSTPSDEAEPKRELSQEQIDEIERPNNIKELSDSERKLLLDFVGADRASVLVGAAEYLRVKPHVTLLAETMAKMEFPPGESFLAYFLIRKLVRAEELGEALRGIVRWMGLMVRQHGEIVAVLRTKYPQTDLFVHHMMDMEVAYSDKPKLDFSNQIIRMQKLDEAFPGTLLHFAAFDPFRRDKALPLAQHAVNDSGAVGLKIYPPTGYRAAENATYKFPPLENDADKWERERWNSRYHDWTEVQLDKTLEGAFGWVASSGVPIFTHCTPTGFEAVPTHGKVPGYGMMADPFFWASALEKAKGFRLCFGHSGGEAYWFSDPVNDAANEKNKPPGHPWQFGNQVVKLCLKYPDVYCEVGYLNEIFKPQQAEALVRRLKAVVDLPSDDGKWRFGDKLMYGTDWHMMYKEPHYEKYLEKWDEVIKRVDKDQGKDGALRKGFFAGNAKRFLGLDELAKDQRFTPEQQKQLAALSAGIK